MGIREATVRCVDGVDAAAARIFALRLIDRGTRAVNVVVGLIKIGPEPHRYMVSTFSSNIQFENCRACSANLPTGSNRRSRQGRRWSWCIDAVNGATALRRSLEQLFSDGFLKFRYSVNCAADCLLHR